MAKRVELTFVRVRHDRVTTVIEVPDDATASDIRRRRYDIAQVLGGDDAPWKEPRTVRYDLSRILPADRGAEPELQLVRTGSRIMSVQRVPTRKK